MSLGQEEKELSDKMVQLTASLETAETKQEKTSIKYKRLGMAKN